MSVAVVVWGLILWAVVFHRKRGDRLPPQVRYNLPIEILYTALPFVLIAVLFYYTAKDEDYHRQFVRQPGRDGQRGRLPVELAVPVPAVQGAHHRRGDGQRRDATRGRCRCSNCRPGRTVRFNLTSPDVIHSFWMPEFLFKRDVIPGHPNHFQVTLTQTGTYLGHCSELCGLYHSRMLFTLKVVTPAQFRQWISARQAASNSSSSGQPATATASRSGVQ